MVVVVVVVVMVEVVVVVVMALTKRNTIIMMAITLVIEELTQQSFLSKTNRFFFVCFCLSFVLHYLGVFCLFVCSGSFFFCPDENCI